MKKLSYLERFEIESALNFRCWRIRDRQDSSTALLHNVTGLQEKVSTLEQAGFLLESGEQDGLQFALTPDREELIDLGVWKFSQPDATLGEFTRLFASVPGGSVPAPSTPNISGNATQPRLGEFTSIFLSAAASGQNISYAPDDRAASIPDPLSPDDVPTVQIKSPIPRSATPPQAPTPSEPDLLLERRWSGRAPIVSPQYVFPQSPVEAPKPPHSPASESRPSAPAAGGEFAQLFAKPAEITSPPPQANSLGATTLFPVSEPSPASEPPKAPVAGEFTQFFRPGAPKPAPAPQSPISEPGGFTSLFQAPNIGSTPASTAPPPINDHGPGNPDPAPGSVGGLTAMFAAPAVNPPPANTERQSGPVATPSHSAPQSSPDFDKFFGSPLASNQESMEARLYSDQPIAPERPLAQEPGQFTRLFGRDEIDAAIGRSPQPAGAPLVLSQGSPTAPGATSLFPALPMEKETASPVQASWETPAEAMSGPSEFTRVFQRPSASAPAPPPTAPAPAPIEQVKAAKGRVGKVLKIVLAAVAMIVAALVAFFVFYKKHH